MMQENLFVAGSISTQEVSVANLQGVQFTGTVSLLTANDDIRARKTVLLTFPCGASRHPCAFMAITIARN